LLFKAFLSDSRDFHLEWHMSARRLLNRVQGRVFGWFDSKEAREATPAAVKMLSSRARLVVDSLEDRVVPAFFVVTSDSNSTTDVPASGTGTSLDPFLIASLPSAVINANSNPDASSTIRFDSTFFNTAKTITLTATMFPTKGLTIEGLQDGSGNNLVTITGNAGIRTMKTSNAPAGTVMNFDKLTFANVDLPAGFAGGAIRIDDEVVNITNSRFENNKADQGGAIGISSAGTVNISNTAFINNGSILTTTANSLGGGGAIWMTAAANLTISNSQFTGNSANQQGGALLVSAGTVTVNNSVFQNNIVTKTTTSAFAGLGATFTLFFAGTTLNLNNSTVSGASSGSEGGFAYLGQLTPNLNVTNSTISNNTATDYGGGLSTGTAGTVSFTNSTISGNTANIAGGVLTLGAVTNLSFTNSTISGNTSNNNGGGLYFFAQNSTTTTKIRNSTITGNVANSTDATSKGGGGIIAINTTGTLQVDSTIISGNTHAGALQNLDLAFFGATLKSEFSAIGSPNGHPAVLTKISSPTPGTNLPYGLDLQLQPLADNGGANQGLTSAPTKGFTHELGTTSPARNAGSNIVTALTTDQRGTGFPRELPSGKPDIGALESTPPLIPTVGATFSNITTQSVTPSFGGNATTHFFTVTYTAPTGKQINDGNNSTTQSLGNTDITVTGPGGYSKNATFDSSTSTDNNATVVAKYSIPSNDLLGVSNWDYLDSGDYIVNMNANEVSATGSGFVPDGTIGTILAVIGKTYIVNTDSDDNDGDITNTETSLREAVENAAILTPGALDLITFDNAIFTSDKTIIQGSTLTINTEVHITNSTGKSITLAANAPGFRPVTIDNAASSTISVLIDGLTISGGDITTVDGGGVLVGQNDNVTFRNSTITNNKTDAEGGGIAVNTGGTLTLVNTTVSGNSSAVGGGVYFVNNGSLNITGSTISGNTASLEGGGVYFFGNAGLLRILNSTVSSNSARIFGGGIALRSFGTTSPLEVLNSTIAFNTAQTGGGISRVFGLGTVTITSTIVSDNDADFAPDISVFGNSSANSLNAGFSAIGVNPGAALFATNTSNLFGTDLALAPLANNGGTTKTHAIQAGSAARNAGTAIGGITPSTDQRGATRSVGQTDIGAFEAEAPPPLAAPGATPVLTEIGSTSPFAGTNSYTFAVRYSADTTAPGTFIDTNTLGNDDITVTGPGGYSANAVFTGSVDLSGSAKTLIEATYTISANALLGTNLWDPLDFGSYSVSVNSGKVVDGNAVPVAAGSIGGFLVTLPQVITVDTNIDVVDANDGVTSLREAVELANTIATHPAIDEIRFFAGTPSGNQVSFATNQTITLASALNVTDSLTIIGQGSTLLTISGGGATRHFAVTNSAPYFTITGATLTGGSSGTNGGSITLTNQIATFNDVVFDNNQAPSGAAIAGTGGPTVILDNSDLTNNTSNGVGFVTGAIFFNAANEVSNLTIRNGSLIKANTTPGGSGSVLGVIGKANVLIQGSEIRENQQVDSFTGGVINFFGTAISGNTLVVEDSLIDSNNTGGDGAFAAARGGISVAIRRSTITNNNATFDGGVISFEGTLPTTLTVEDSLIDNNKAGGVGGAFFLSQGTATFSNSTFFGNTAQGSGSVIRLGGTSSATIRNSTITANSSNDGAVVAGAGGALSGTAGTTLTLTSTIVSGNFAAAGNDRPDIASAGTVNATNSAIGDANGFTLTTNVNNLTPTEIAGLNLDSALALNGATTTKTIALLAGSTAIDRGLNPAPALAFDQRGAGFARVSGSAADIGAFEVQAATPTVTSFAVNAGNAQRSRIVSVELTFSSNVNAIDFSDLNDIYFERTKVASVVTGAVGDKVASGPIADNHVTVSPVAGFPNKLLLTFDNTGVNQVNNNKVGVESGSLSDGYWQLFVDGTAVSLINDVNLRRLYGDVAPAVFVPPTGTVDGTDLTEFGNAFGTNSTAFDFNNDGTVDGNDLTTFGNRFGNVL
jgi:hypothetical protein